MTGWGTGWGTELAKAEQDALLHGTGIVKVTVDSIEHISIPQFLNKHPTHDPYTNPNAHIYYQCGCGAILDPGTKSFAALNNCASDKGWKVRWGADSYVPYCVKCGEDVE
jgi:hypothetical protein